MITEKEKRSHLIGRGYCVFDQVLTSDMLDRVKQVSDRLLDAQDADHFEAQKSTGSLICVYEDSFFSELIAWQPALDILHAMGFDRPTFSTGFVISKPPQSPPLFWHQDWWGWNDPVSYRPMPQQTFLMYYLVDTTPANGCLRLIEGSHLKRHPVHDVVPDAHTDDLRRVTDPDHPAYQSHAGEIDVPVRAGDLVIGDARLLHSAHANKTDRRRTVITLWYHPCYDDLPQGMQVRLSRHKLPEHWPEEARDRVTPLMPKYEGDASELEWNRIPGKALL
ncbi:MAG: phytanoyl-CoA dioxygenase family protein [bacterium]|jgi:hypothetical protein|nr:phytanoyl-CoA dioxygenase family protein [bacterium]